MLYTSLPKMYVYYRYRFQAMQIIPQSNLRDSTQHKLCSIHFLYALTYFLSVVQTPVYTDVALCLLLNKDVSENLLPLPYGFSSPQFCWITTP